MDLGEAVGLLRSHSLDDSPVTLSYDDGWSDREDGRSVSVYYDDSYGWMTRNSFVEDTEYTFYDSKKDAVERAVRAIESASDDRARSPRGPP